MKFVLWWHLNKTQINTLTSSHVNKTLGLHLSQRQAHISVTIKNKHQYQQDTEIITAWM